MPKIVTLGEIMLRLSPPLNGRISNASLFDVCYGGAEANVAASLSLFGNDAVFVSRVPDNELGHAAEAFLKARGVNTGFLSFGGSRLGIYYLETGSSLRPSKVVYDRAHSAISEANEDDFDFDAVFKGAEWFHWSGITPALSENCAKLVEKACQAAKKAGATVSCDLNYRKKLWSKEQARRTMTALMKYVDVCIGNEEDAEACLGYVPVADVTHGKTDAQGYYDIFRRMADDFGLKYVATTLRESISASRNGWKALIYDGANFYESKRYDIYPIVDRVGSGDAFSAGLIHSLANGKDAPEALEFAVAASALKHTIAGDFNAVSIAEIEALVAGDGSGRVQR